VDSSSFFDLERGALTEEFNYYHLINGIAGAVLTLTVRPYSNTATHRLIASVPAATSAVVKFAATGIDGDTYALANLEVRVGSQVASAGRLVAWGVHPHPSHNPYRAATSGLAQTGATVRGASGAIGSQYTAIPVSPTGASGVAYTVFLDPPDAHIGRHRVIAVARSGLEKGIPLYAEDRFGAILGPTAIASQTDQSKWQVVDLGEVNVPARASGQDAVPTQFVNIYGGGASGIGINASPALQLNGIMFLPLEYSAGILRTKGGALPAFSDSFTRLSSGQVLESSPSPEVGQPWSKVGGYLLGLGSFSLGGHVTVSNASAIAAAATGFYDGASGALYSDVNTSMSLNVEATSTASGAYVELWAKRIPAGVSQGIWARLTFGPSQTLQLLTGNGAVATVLASAGIASTLASGILIAQTHTLTIRTSGGRADAWLATGPLSASPVLSASNGLVTQPGNLAVRMQNGGNPNFAPWIDDVRLSVIAGASDIGARETFRFESHPEGRIYQGTASVFTADRLADYRGQFPKMPPVPTAATGPARVVVLQGEIDNLQGLDGPDIALSVLERFRFLR
jgi:hypothetical protein